MYCRRCGKVIPSINVNVQALIAKCDDCGEVFSFEGVEEKRPARKHGRRPPVARPESVTIEEFPDGPRIVRRWFRLYVLGLAAFAVFWDGFLVNWYWMALSGGFHGEHGTGWTPILFPLLHVRVGVGLTYFVIASIFNRTIVRADRGGLAITHGPIPWRSPRPLDRSEIMRIYCQDHFSQNRRGGTLSYGVHAIDRSGRRVKLLSGLSDKDEAMFIERWIEERLGLPDDPVEGEV
ncbi:MAG: hypothetical protein IT450_18410 [Phycisphaerales bacterium]|nr:hypothetical protein [Phycisphaerales bacterium]